MPRYHFSQNRSPDFYLPRISQIAAKEGGSSLVSSPFSKILPFVSIVRLWSGSSRGRRRATVSLLFRLLPFRLTAVRFRWVASKLRVSFFFLFSSPCPSTLRALSCFAHRFIKYACVREERKDDREKYRSLRRFTFQSHTLFEYFFFSPTGLLVFPFYGVQLETEYVDLIDLYNVPVTFTTIMINGTWIN